jgi:hypothetical protein
MTLQFVAVIGYVRVTSFVRYPKHLFQIPPMSSRSLAIEEKCTCTIGPTRILSILANTHRSGSNKSRNNLIVIIIIYSIHSSTNSYNSIVRRF